MTIRLRFGGAILAATVLAAAGAGAGQQARPPVPDPTVAPPPARPAVPDPAVVKAHKAAAKGRHHSHHKPKARKP